MNVSVALFGAFRDLGEPELVLDVPEGTTVAALRNEIAAAMRERRPDFRHLPLIARSALGDDVEILDESRVLAPDARLALLPPVCGG